MRPQALPVILLAVALGACAHGGLPDACYEKPASGRGKVAHKRFYYDPDTRTCKPFIWGGRNGTVPFETLEACSKTCNAPGPDEASGARKAVPADTTEDE